MPGRVEDEHLVAELLEPLARARHARRRDAEHRRADERPVAVAPPARSPSPCPAIAPAALARIRAEIRLMPAMSTTEYIIVTSLAPTYGRVSPEATVETISFGTPTGSARIACVAIDVPPEPPSASDPVEPPLGVQPAHDLGRAARHRVDGGAAVARGGERGDVGAGRGGDLLARDVRLGQRLAQDAGVDEHDVDAVLAQPVAQERVLAPFVSSVPRRTTVGTVKPLAVNSDAFSAPGAWGCSSASRRRSVTIERSSVAIRPVDLERLPPGSRKYICTSPPGISQIEPNVAVKDPELLQPPVDRLEVVDLDAEVVVRGATASPALEEMELEVAEPEPADRGSRSSASAGAPCRTPPRRSGRRLDVVRRDADVIDPRCAHARSLSELGAACNDLLRTALPGEPGGEHDLVARCDELQVADRERRPAEHVERAQERRQRDPHLELVAVDRRQVDAEHRRDVEVDRRAVLAPASDGLARASTSAGSSVCACSSLARTFSP